MQEQTVQALVPLLSKSKDDNPNMAKLPYKVSTVGLSDMGLVRHNNEDVGPSNHP